MLLFGGFVYTILNVRRRVSLQLSINLFQYLYSKLSAFYWILDVKNYYVFLTFFGISTCQKIQNKYFKKHLQANEHRVSHDLKQKTPWIALQLDRFDGPWVLAKEYWQSSFLRKSTKKQCTLTPEFRFLDIAQFEDDQPWSFSGSKDVGFLFILEVSHGEDMITESCHSSALCLGCTSIN